jgi:hypothetical protein
MVGGSTSFPSARAVTAVPPVSRRKLMALPTESDIRDKIAELPFAPFALEALWDGDTTGWGIALSAVSASDESHFLAWFRDSGDIRLFHGAVPPWPEAKLVGELGNKFAGELRVPLYFPSPNHPEDECPTWSERSQGYPCRDCGTPLLQRDPCPWRGVCYQCHLKAERETRTAAANYLGFGVSEERA